MRADRKESRRPRDVVICSLTRGRRAVMVKSWNTPGVKIGQMSYFFLKTRVLSSCSGAKLCNGETWKGVEPSRERFNNGAQISQIRHKRQTESDSCCNKVKSGRQLSSRGRKMKDEESASLSFPFVSTDPFKLERPTKNKYWTQVKYFYSSFTPFCFPHVTKKLLWEHQPSIHYCAIVNNQLSPKFRLALISQIQCLTGTLTLSPSLHVSKVCRSWKYIFPYKCANLKPCPTYPNVLVSLTLECFLFNNRHLKLYEDANIATWKLWNLVTVFRQQFQSLRWLSDGWRKHP